MTRRKTNLITILLLVLGLGSALAVFLCAPPEEPGDPLLGDPRALRKYHRELAMYGGKANVLSAEFLEWFDRLWHGQRLAGTVAVLTLAGTWAFRTMAAAPRPAVPSEGGRTTPDETI